MKHCLATLSAEEMHFVFALRRDFLGQMLAEIEEAIPAFATEAYRYNLKALSLDEAREAIVQPLKKIEAKIDYDDAFIDGVLLARLAAQEGEQQGINPPHLQIVCHQLFEAAHQRYQDTGRVVVIDEALDEALGGAASSPPVMTARRGSGTATAARRSPHSKDTATGSKAPRSAPTENASSPPAGIERRGSGTAIAARRSPRSKGIVAGSQTPRSAPTVSASSPPALMTRRSSGLLTSTVSWRGQKSASPSRSPIQPASRCCRLTCGSSTTQATAVYRNSLPCENVVFQRATPLLVILNEVKDLCSSSSKPSDRGPSLRSG